MTYLYPLLAITSLTMTVLAYVLAPVVALFVQTDGNLPSWLRWFQPVDNFVIGDQKWISEHSDYSPYMLALTYMLRNPAQGFDSLLKANVTDGTPFKTYGNVNIKDGISGIAGFSLVTTEKYFHLTIIYELKWWLPYFSLALVGVAFWLFQYPSLVFIAEIINWTGIVLLVISLYAIIVDIRTGVGICARSEFGWRLGSLVGGYQHKTRGQIVCTPIRLYKFTKG